MALEESMEGVTLSNHGDEQIDLGDGDLEVWSEEDMAKLSLTERRRLVAWIVEMIASDVAESISSGSYFAHSNAHAIRALPQVDERGWRELSQVHQEAFEEVLRIQAASAERLEESGEAGVTALSALLCCELPVDRPPEPVMPRKTTG